MKALPACLAVSALAMGGPALAQPDYEAIVRIMLECERIADQAARVACYDNTMKSARLIASAQQDGSAPSAGGAPPAPASAAPTGAAVASGTRGAQGFGAETIRPLPSERADQVAEVRVRLASVERRTPGIYRFTLEDGAVWEFTDAVSSSYNPPSRGSSVELERGSLGGFFMRYASQPGVRVKRIR